MKVNFGLFAAIVALSFFVGIRAKAGSRAATSPAITVGAVRGTVKFAGVAPKPARINMASDPDCSKLHPEGATSQELLSAADGSLQNVIVYISDGLGDRSFDPPAQAVTAEQKGCQYLPHVLALQANQKLDVMNLDRTTHNIHPLPANNLEWNKSQPPGMSIEVSFARPEIAIPVKCNVHPWMRSYIAVFKHPYFEVTGKDGSFDLENLPPGEYTLQAWHEKLGTSVQKFTVGAAETKTVNFTFSGEANRH